MKILIAEDEPAFRRILEDTLTRWGYQVVVTNDGNEAWQALRAEDAPRLAIVDWLMPGMDGLELCRRIRRETNLPYVYLILLTSQQSDADVVAGMEAGADDYVFKPFKTNELRVRLNAGKRIVELQHELAARACDLELANHDLEDFSYTVSNDLLKSLMSIGDAARSIQDLVAGAQDEQCKTYTRLIYHKVKHLADLIGIMHVFFRPTTSELQREMLDLSQMAEEAAENLSMTKPGGRRVAFRIAKGLKAHADRNLVRVILQNLLDNSWKHTAGRDEAIIEFGVAEVEGKKAAYFVRDNGAGFDMEHVAQLFKPFQSLPGSEQSAGRGVGLATVSRFVLRHGGQVWAEGVPDGGATFYFTLSGAGVAH